MRISRQNCSVGLVPSLSDLVRDFQMFQTISTGVNTNGMIINYLLMRRDYRDCEMCAGNNTTLTQTLTTLFHSHVKIKQHSHTKHEHVYCHM